MSVKLIEINELKLHMKITDTTSRFIQSVDSVPQHSVMEHDLKGKSEESKKNLNVKVTIIIKFHVLWELHV